MSIKLRKQDILRLKNDPVIDAVYSSAKELNIYVYLVGGIVRNIISKLPIGYDYDFVLSMKAKDAAEKLALIIKGSPFLLDKESGSFRVVIKKNNASINVDLSPIKGRDIIEDIFKRDFTINAMAIDMKKLFEKDVVPIIDPLNGARHGKKKLIAPAREDIFDNDPIRLLRAVRLSAQYGFSIDEDMEYLIKAKSYLLKTSSWERIRDEFFAIINCHNVGNNIKKLWMLGLLQEIFPEIKEWDKLEDYDLKSHVIKTVVEGEKILYNLKKLVPEYEDAVLSHFDSLIGNIPRSAFFKFAVFLHDIGKPVSMKIDGERLRFTGHEIEGETITKKIAKRLKLSNRASRILCKLVRNHHRVFNMASLGRILTRSKAYFFRIMDKDGIDLLFLSLADAQATRGGEDTELAMFVRNLTSFYFDAYIVKKPTPLLKGGDVMRIFNIPQGIMIGRILKKIQDAEGMGLIKNRKDAVRFIKKWLADKSAAKCDNFD